MIAFSQLRDRHLRVSEKSDHHEGLDNGHAGAALIPLSHIHDAGDRDDDDDGGIISEAG